MPKDPFVFITKSGTKQIRNKNGYVLMRYPKIPKNIQFKHKAVNDYNQHLCGGWFVHEHDDFEEIDRVVAGLKPVGISHAVPFLPMIERAIKYVEKGYLMTYEKNRVRKGTYNITVSPTGKLKNYFDMDTLIADYERNGLYSDDIEFYKDVTFAAFHNGQFDNHPTEIVGLILGYPIENTISLMKRY